MRRWEGFPGARRLSIPIHGSAPLRPSITRQSYHIALGKFTHTSLVLWYVDTPLVYISVLILHVKATTIHGWHHAPQTSQSIPDVHSHTTPPMGAHISLSNWQTAALSPGSTTHIVGTCGIFKNVTLTLWFIHSRIVKILPALQPFRHNQPIQHLGTHRPSLLLPQFSKKMGRRKDCSRRRFVRFLIARGWRPSSGEPKSSKGTSLGTYPTGFVARSQAVTGRGTAATCCEAISERSIETSRSSSTARRELRRSTMRRGWLSGSWKRILPWNRQSARHTPRLEKEVCRWVFGMHEGKGSSNPHFPSLSECLLMTAAQHRTTTPCLEQGQCLFYRFVTHCSYCNKLKQLEHIQFL